MPIKLVMLFYKYDSIVSIRVHNRPNLTVLYQDLGRSLLTSIKSVQGQELSPVVYPSQLAMVLKKLHYRHVVVTQVVHVSVSTSKRGS